MAAVREDEGGAVLGVYVRGGEAVQVMITRARVEHDASKGM